MFKKNFPIIRNGGSKRCLIVYIVDPILNQKGKKTHTNQLEICKLYEIFVEMGYGVDVIDFRDSRNFKRMDWSEYSFVLSIDDLNLDKIYRKKNSSCKVIYFATGANFLWNNPADIASVEKVKKRFRRMGISVDSLKADRIYNENYKKSIYAFARLDAIWYMGNEWTKSTYNAYSVPMYQIKNTGFFSKENIKEIKIEDKKNYLWFGGSGMIHKGLDLCIQVFEKFPDLHLFVAGPKDNYWSLYEQYFNLKNVSYEGFLDIQSDRYRLLCQRCMFAILPSCSEGAATSILSVMHMGVIPMVSKETGIDVDSCGFVIERSVESIENTIKCSQNLKVDKLIELSNNSIEYVAREHSMETYTRSIVEAARKMEL